MNHRIEPHFEPSVGRVPSSHDSDVQALVAALSAANPAIVIAADSTETTRTVREAAVALAAAGGAPAPGRCADIVVVFDQWAGEPSTGLIDTIAVAVDSATGTLITRPNPDPRSLAEVLAYWGERCAAGFVIVLDHFDRNLAAEPLRSANARFTEQLAQAIEAQPQRARFLIVVNAHDEGLIQRLSARLSRPCTNLVRLAPPARAYATRAQAAPRRAPAAAKPAEDALPRGFSAYGEGEERIDSAATDAMLRRRAARRRRAKLGILAGAGLAVVATVAVSVTALRSRLPDPGALLSRPIEASPAPPAAQTLAAAPQSPASPAVEARLPAPADTVPAAPAPAPAAESARETAPATPNASTVAAASSETADPPRPPAGPVDAPAPAVERPAMDPPAAAEVSKPDSKSEPKPEPKPESKPESKPEPKPEPKPEADSASAPPARQDERPAAFRVDAPPGPPVAEKLVRNVPNPERGPLVFIHIRSDAQRAKARELERNLARLGIVVSGIRVDEKGPLHTDLRYFRSGERDEANYLRGVLGRMGMSTARTTLVSGYEPIAVRRHYELWLAPPAGH